MFLRNVGWNSTDCMAHIPEDDTLHNHRCENLKSYKGNDFPSWLHYGKSGHGLSWSINNIYKYIMYSGTPNVLFLNMRFSVNVEFQWSWVNFPHLKFSSV
jgi:hypothetical protein